MGTGEAAVRTVALLHPQQIAGHLRRRQGPGQRPAARPPDGQHVAAGLGLSLIHI